MASKTKQPASTSYFFGKSYQDLKSILALSWKNNGDSIRTHASSMRSGGNATTRLGAAVRFLYHLSAIIAISVFGSVISVLLSCIHIVGLFAATILVYLLFGAVWALDRLYLVLHKISVECRGCHAKFLIPHYLCPKCGARHTKLTPGRYGIFTRKCRCGEILPTSVFNVRIKRKDLPAECPSCHRALSGESMTRPLCIPVVGGASVGKSAFITAYANRFIEDVSVERDIDAKLYSGDEARYAVMQRDFRRGTIEKTRAQTDLSKPSSIAFSYYVSHKSLSTDRLIHLFDIAGETFAGNTENEMQKQYDYCDGIVLLIDPFAIPDVMARFGERLNADDRGGVSETSLDFIIENFIRKLEQTTGLSEGRILATPLAVVLSKVDAGRLDAYVGEPGIRRAMSRSPEVFTDYYDTMDWLCRRFLVQMDMENIYRHLTTNFKNIRFFSISAIGHTIRAGRYAPVDVLPVVDWILLNNDRRLAAIAADTEFSGKPLPVAKVI